MKPLIALLALTVLLTAPAHSENAICGSDLSLRQLEQLFDLQLRKLPGIPTEFATDRAALIAIDVRTACGITVAGGMETEQEAISRVVEKHAEEWRSLRRLLGTAGR